MPAWYTGVYGAVQVKKIVLKFERDEDLALYERLSADAKKQRYPITVYTLLVLLQAYPAASTDEAGPTESSE